MEGYLSDNDMYDSYRKLPFVPFNKCKGKKVLDIGSNQGFFSFQASIHGASEVLGIELTEQDVLAANDIKEITGIDNVIFISGDAIEYVMNSEEHSRVIKGAIQKINNSEDVSQNDMQHLFRSLMNGAVGMDFMIEEKINKLNSRFEKLEDFIFRN